MFGYVTSDAAPSDGSGLYNSIAPTRMADTRVPLGASTLSPLTSAGVDTPAATSGASAIAQNITATNTTGPGWLSAHPGPVAPVVSKGGETSTKEKGNNKTIA